MRQPELGYTSQNFTILDVPDNTRASLEALRGNRIDALAISTSTWDPFGLERNAHWVKFLQKVYAYEPDVPADQIPALLGLKPVARFERHGQWIELFQAVR